MGEDCPPQEVEVATRELLVVVLEALLLIL